MSPLYSGQPWPPDRSLKLDVQYDRTERGVGLTEAGFVLSCLRTGCPVCCPVLVPMPLFHPYRTHNAPSAQKGKEKKKAKYDSLQDLRKNKKELEFEQKLYKEKEEMLEKEKQLKINRLAQEVCAQSWAILVPTVLPRAHSPQTENKHSLPPTYAGSSEVNSRLGAC